MFILFLSIQLDAQTYINIYIMDIIDKVSKEMNISKNILITIASIESSISPYVLSFNENNKEIYTTENILHSNSIKFKKLKYKLGYRIVAYPNTIQKARILCDYVKNKKNVDYGLMQINSSNIERWGENKLDILIDNEKNIRFAAKVIRNCYDKFNKNIKKSIECYNKGYKESNFNYSYYKKFKRAYYAL